MSNTNSLAVELQAIDKAHLAAVGGKAANLGELNRVDGIRVPAGFCITTFAFKRIIEDSSLIKNLLEQLSALTVEELTEIRHISHEIRKAIEGIAIPQCIIDEICRFLPRHKENIAFAIRSSATAEDLPTASFAGQQDSYLNIVGKDAILEHVRHCWASLYTDRAVIYRLQNGIDHRTVYLSVIIQEMVFPDAAGVVFTADPLTSNRKILSIDANFGLGEAVVSGLVNADNYRVCQDKIIDRKISAKTLTIHALESGGTTQREVEREQQTRPALTDEQILQLTQMARRIEAHFGHPQDIEWCLADGIFYIVQSRPITTLYPVPDSNDQNNHIYASVGHQQMMTDPMKPLGLSFFLLTTPAPMRTAGGRLFVDVAPALASPDSRSNLLTSLGRSDPLVKDVLLTLLERGYVETQPDAGSETGGPLPPVNGVRMQPNSDPALVNVLIRENEQRLNELKLIIQDKSGADLFDYIQHDIQELRKILFDPRSLKIIMEAIDASLQLNEKAEEWLGEKGVADIISQSVPKNITSEMGLALLDVADVIRPYPEIVGYLRQVKDEHFLDELPFEGGHEVQTAIKNYLSKYGVRCAGEIDITRTRWRERPAILIPLILGNVKNFEHGASRRKFEQGLQEAKNKEHDILVRLRRLPHGEEKAKETKHLIDLIRTFGGYREYPKYSMVDRYFVYKEALLKEASQLVNAKVIREKEDIYFLSFEELREVVHTQQLDYQIISRRKEEHRLNRKLTPPRVITSDGEILNGQYKRDGIPDGAIAGLAVSCGVVEGRARVVLNMEESDLEDGDILITRFTDPSWTPLFVSIKGLITEVGGLMTHGAVIAREYGLPAVVGVENATSLIKDGQRIRVDGTHGFVELI